MNTSLAHSIATLPVPAGVFVISSLQTVVLCHMCPLDICKSILLLPSHAEKSSQNQDYYCRCSLVSCSQACHCSVKCSNKPFRREKMIKIVKVRLQFSQKAYSAYWYSLSTCTYSMQMFKCYIIYLLFLLNIRFSSNIWSFTLMSLFSTACFCLVHLIFGLANNCLIVV